MQELLDKRNRPTPISTGVFVYLTPSLTGKKVKMTPPKFQVNGLFEIKADNWDECLNILSIASERGLKALSINIYEVKILNAKESTEKER